jgi:hypothetical protein
MIIDCFVSPEYKTDTSIESLDQYVEFFSNIKLGHFNTAFKQITFSFDNSTAGLKCEDFDLQFFLFTLIPEDDYVDKFTYFSDPDSTEETNSFCTVEFSKSVPFNKIINDFKNVYPFTIMDFFRNIYPYS